jgi:NADH:ubiquinone oxidoreductase subunit K
VRVFSLFTRREVVNIFLIIEIFMKTLKTLKSLRFNEDKNSIVEYIVVILFHNEYKNGK